MASVTRRDFISIAAGSVLASTAQAAVKPQIRKPIIFSYDWPVSGTSSVGSQPLPSSFFSVDLDTATIIDIGPRKSAYPPAKVDHYEPDVFDFWKSKGVRLVRRGRTHRHDITGKKAGFCTYDELVEHWSNALDEPGVSGIAIDEFYSHDIFFSNYVDAHDEMIFDTWTRALKTLRKSYPDKLIFCWMWGWSDRSGEILSAFRDYADYFVPEIYYDEKDAPGFPDFTFPRFRESIAFFENLAPGITKKTVIGLGFHEALWDSVPGIDYGDFIKAQVKAVGNDPELTNVPGVAIYKPAALSKKNIKRLNAALKKYVLR